nr:MAG TPA: hypothetical protein [Caudoviricetes sp.]
MRFERAKNEKRTRYVRRMVGGSRAIGAESETIRLLFCCSKTRYRPRGTADYISQSPPKKRGRRKGD